MKDKLPGHVTHLSCTGTTHSGKMLRDHQKRAGHVGLSGVLSHCKANLEKPGHHLRLSEERNIIKLAKAEEENIDTDTAVTRHLESFHCTDHAVRFG